MMQMFFSSVPLSMLCLGDSYTIGEAVEKNESFPLQTTQMLSEKNFRFSEPRVIAKTGWTTDELKAAIEAEKPEGKFDFVTLLIGVNNQYRGRDLKNFEDELTALLHSAIDYANGNKQNVVVFSIPDWGVTPFIAQDNLKRSREQVHNEIDAFNNIKQKVCAELQIHFIDITPHSRNAKHDRALIAEDGLHPSGKMYAHWAALLSEHIAKTLSEN